MCLYIPFICGGGDKCVSACVEVRGCLDGVKFFLPPHRSCEKQDPHFLLRVWGPRGIRPRHFLSEQPQQSTDWSTVSPLFLS